MIVAISTSNLIALLLLLGVCGWFAWDRLRKSAEPGTLVAKGVASAVLIGILIKAVIPHMFDGYNVVVLLPVGVLLALIVGTMWAPHILRFFTEFLTSNIDGGLEEPERRPLYSIAEGKRARGLFREAIIEIQGQLAKFPGDFTGVMMLAQIQAEHLEDLDSAGHTISRLLGHPGRSPSEIAAALHQVADWHLRFGCDPDSAREALQEIVRRLPDTSLARSAEERIAHLGTASDMAAAREHAPIAMQPFEKDIGLQPGTRLARKGEIDPKEEALNLVRQLEKHPLDSEARERLAVLYAEEYQRPDLAIEQIRELVNAPNAAAKSVVRWLNEIADFQVKHQNDIDAARRTLQQIRDRFPNTAAADQAFTRLNYLSLEKKPSPQAQPIRLGIYEKDVGLKRPRL